MRKRNIPHNAIVFVGDGCKALFLRNEGDEKFTNFVTGDVFVDENPTTRDQRSDKPARAFAYAHTTRRSAMEPTDWHGIEEHRFAARVSEALERWCGSAAPGRSSSRPRRARWPTCATRFTRT